MKELPIPPHFDPDQVSAVWKVDYQRLADAAPRWAGEHGIGPAREDGHRMCLLLVDVQNTFCIPGFELFVAGRSGTGAVDDNRRLCQFLYRNLGRITGVVLTLDTHQAMQIFHPIFLVDGEGNHPGPMTQVTLQDVESGRWRCDEKVAENLGQSPEYLQRHLEHYVRQLKETGKLDLTVWPYHAMLGGIGHALVSSVEEAVFFHTMARTSQPDIHVKGDNPLTEHYSALGPEVRTGPDGQRIGGKSEKFLDVLRDYDLVAIAGQAKSHCVAWTIADLLDDVLAADRSLVEKVYLLEDCTSPVVVPEVVDFTAEAGAAFQRFADAGMHVVRSTDPVASWPDVGASALA